MDRGFLNVPETGDYRLANATVPRELLSIEGTGDTEGLTRVDIDVSNGAIAAVTPAGTSVAPAPTTDLDGGIVHPCFVDMHTHLDKGHIWPRRPNPDGTFDGALENVEADRTSRWSDADVSTRMDFSLRCAFAHGTAAIRTHLDSRSPQHSISWPVFSRMRETWAGRIDLQGVALVAIDTCRDRVFTAELVETVARHGGILGCVTFPVPDIDDLLDDLMRRASDTGLDLDMHVDETGDPQSRTLQSIAEAIERTGYGGKVTAGHCCSLSTQPEDVARDTIAAVAETGITVVSLPMCNMYLQDRNAGRTPRWRGVTMLHELAEAGVPTAVASDNTRDPFYAYGDLDMLEVMRETVRIAHLDHPIDITRLAHTVPAASLGRPDDGKLGSGAPADLVAFRARTWTELFSRPQADRTVIRSGRAIDRTLPDYRELDTLMEPT